MRRKSKRPLGMVFFIKIFMVAPQKNKSSYLKKINLIREYQQTRAMTAKPSEITEKGICNISRS
jgi:hypothetical protein